MAFRLSVISRLLIIDKHEMMHPHACVCIGIASVCVLQLHLNKGDEAVFTWWIDLVGDLEHTIILASRVNGVAAIFDFVGFGRGKAVASCGKEEDSEKDRGEKRHTGVVDAKLAEEKRIRIKTPRGDALPPYKYTCLAE